MHKRLRSFINFEMTIQRKMYFENSTSQTLFLRFVNF